MPINPTSGSTTTPTTTPTTTTTTTPTTTTPTTQQTPPDYLNMIQGLTGLPFDPNTVINALLQAQQVPIQNLQTQINNINTNESIYKSIGADVANLQSIAFNLTLQSTIQANAATSSNTAALSATANPTAQTGTYTVAINSLATATTATSTNPVGQSIDALASSTPLSGLNLAGTPTGGTVSVVVDGQVRTITVDPTKPLLDAPGTTPPQGALSQLQAAITGALQSSDPGAAATVSVSGDKVQIGFSGGTGSHSISFGAAGDSSNFLALMNLSTVQGSVAAGGSATLSSTANVGVASINQPLASANLATTLTGAPGAGGAPTGSFSINGVSISWDAGTDSVNSIIGRINSSSAGVTAQYNSVTDQLTLTSNTTGQTAMNLVDTSGNFLAAMHLAPGTTGAQKLGTNANITVNGTTVTSTSNTITNAAPGLTISATATTAAGSPATLTVGPDVTNITKQVQSLVDAANKVLNDINLTQQKDPTSGTYSQLLGDPTLNGLKSQILTMITGQLTTSGSYQSLQDIGITTGAVGSTPGTTQNLTLDPTKLAAALSANPSQVAALFSGSVSANGFQGVAQQLNNYLQQQTNPTLGVFAQFQSTGDAEVQSLQQQINTLNTMMTSQRQALMTQFTAMSTTLLSLSAQSSIFTNMTSSSSSSSSGH